jgi:transposase
MVLTRTRTRLKNRIHATLAKYALSVPDASDLFGQRDRALLTTHVSQLPPHTRFATERLLEQIEDLDDQVAQFEDRMREVFTATPELELIMTLPGVAMILGLVIVLMQLRRAEIWLRRDRE